MPHESHIASTTEDIWAAQPGTWLTWTDHLGPHRGTLDGFSGDRLAIVRVWSPRLGRFQKRMSYLSPDVLDIEA